jgi:hypothetical protein
MEGLRRELAQNLAGKLGCRHASREELVEKATAAGIPVGKLEVAVLKQSTPRERLARLKSRYLAFVTASLCDLAGQNDDLVYHGRAGNLLLSGVSHVFRVRVLTDGERQIQQTMARLNLDADKARQYQDRLRQDVGRWVHYVHGAEMGDMGRYDLVLNLGHMSLESASAAICSMAQMPDFRPTPASLRVLDDLCLAARARDILGGDERTAALDLGVSAQQGRVTVTYMPASASKAAEIDAALAALKGAREVVCTMAVSNLMWLSETFDPDSPIFEQVADLAQRWGAAVDLVQLLPADADHPCPPEGSSEAQLGLVCLPKDQDPTGGVADDVEERPLLADQGLTAAAERLIGLRLFGGSRTMRGTGQEVVAAIKAAPRYSLVVVGEVFASRPAAVQMRLRRELSGFITESANLPVIAQQDLQAKYLFGAKQKSRLALFALLTVVIYGVVFLFEGPIVTFFGAPEGTAMRVLSTAVMVCFVPLVAYLYGGATGSLFKWLRFE